MNIAIFKYKLHKILSIPPLKVLKKISNKIGTKIKDAMAEFLDFRKSSWTESGIRVKYSFIEAKQLDTSKIHMETAKYLCDMYLNHYFDILGSGYSRVDYNINPLGLEGIRYDMSPKISSFDIEGEWLNKVLIPPHVSVSKNIWKKADREYIPIDWQMDFKSGFRFSQKVWYKKQPIGKPKGSDIKVPWEISRMQHLPRLSIFSLILPDKRSTIIKEFKNEIYDFAATNPVRMGANWVSAMDVGIRASNILLAHDILKSVDEENIMDNDFENIFGSLIYEHGNFIIQNLEWNDGNNNNHYLSDISGLLFVSAYLERNETTDSWLAFGIQEIINCMEKHFYDDGGNFEESTSYHRLSGELMLYSTALIYGLLNTDKRQALSEYSSRNNKRLISYVNQKYDLDKEMFFPGWYLDKLFNSGCFTLHIVKPNGDIPQVGDNDSGSFFKFTPVGCFMSMEAADKKYLNLKGVKERCKETEIYYDENMLNHFTFVSGVSGLFNYEGFQGVSSDYPLEKSIIKGLSNEFKIEREYSKSKIIVLDNDISKLEYKKNYEILFNDYVIRNPVIEDIKFFPYPNFGLYIFKGSQFYLSVFTGGMEKIHNYGHSHSDKLSFNLNICGKDIFADSGTYLYTSIPEKRDYFRSVKVHNVPIVQDEEQNKFISLFKVKNETKCCVAGYGNNHIKFYLIYRDIRVLREFIINTDKLVINDCCNREFYANFNKNEFYSNGYGKLCHNESNLQGE